MALSGVETNFTAYQRHLWQVLAALGRAGYFVPPQDARDLIHDFYVEEWTGLEQRYDSEQSRFGTYAAAAFYRFARRRIIRLERWRHRTVDLEDTAELASAADMPDQVLESNEQLALIRAGLEGLGTQERDVLLDFLASGESNERALAGRHGLTRYRVREVLANAVGRLLANISADETPATLDARVARSLWVEGQTPRHVALLYGIDTAEVNAARLRFVARLMKSLRKFNHPTTTVRRIMDTEIEILKTALLSAGDAAAVARVRAHADAILGALGDDDIALDAKQTDYLAARPDWVAEVYGALGHDAHEGAEDEVDAALAQMKSDQAREIGEAFAALAEALEDSGDPWRRFAPLRRLAPTSHALRHLMNDPTVEHGGYAALQLLQFGLTPAMIYGATRGLYLQCARLDRLLASGAELSPRQAERDGAFFCVASLHDRRLAYLSRELARAGVAGTRDLPAEAVDPLLAWIKDVLPRFPGLIENYSWDQRAPKDGVDLLLPTIGRPADLAAQWSHQNRTVETVKATIRSGRLADA